jgi:hypothetical protein
MHPAYGAPVKKTASTRLRQYNVEVEFAFLGILSMLLSQLKLL